MLFLCQQFRLVTWVYYIYWSGPPKKWRNRVGFRVSLGKFCGRDVTFLDYFSSKCEHMSDLFIFWVQQNAGVKPSGVTYKMGPHHFIGVKEFHASNDQRSARGPPL